MLTNWNPWQELEALRREVERAVGGMGMDPRLRWRAAFLPGRAARAYPLLNLSDDKENVYVDAIAPGVDPATLEVTVVNGTLRIAGEKQALSAEIAPEAYHRNERSAGKFARTIQLPVDVEGDKVSAEYLNGILHVALPKAEAAKPKQITVKVG